MNFSRPGQASQQVAARLRKYANGKLSKIYLRKNLIKRKPWLGGIPIPKGLEARPFQIPAAVFSLERNRSYLALDPGLGKGVITVLLTNALSRKPFVLICPPFLVPDVREKFRIWAIGGGRVETLTPACELQRDTRILIVPDSLIHRKEVQECIARFNWLGNAVLVVDEAHRYRNGKAKRTRAVLGAKEIKGIVKSFTKVIWLSGTPIPNGRPIELYPILSRQAPETIGFRSKLEFARKYCDAFYNETEGTWDFSGASNLKTLKKNLAPFMLRLRKRDVLKELPPKTEEIVILADKLPGAPNSSRSVFALDKKLLRQYSPDSKELREKMAKLSPHREQPLSTYRRMLGEAKVPLALEFIKGQLDDTDEKILVYCFHKKVLAALAKGLKKYGVVIIDGSTGTAERFARVNAFQKNPKIRVVVGNYACAVGYTLTKATRVIFAEYSWVPADNDQASDRAHRIGQLFNVFVQYLVFKNSLDRTILESNLRKRENTEKI